MTTPAATAPVTTTAAPAAGGEATVLVADSDLGQILTAANGMTVYLFMPDAQGTPTCTDCVRPGVAAADRRRRQPAHRWRRRRRGAARHHRAPGGGQPGHVQRLAALLLRRRLRPRRHQRPGSGRLVVCGRPDRQRDRQRLTASKTDGETTLRRPRSPGLLGSPDRSATLDRGSTPPDARLRCGGDDDGCSSASRSPGVSPHPSSSPPTHRASRWRHGPSAAGRGDLQPSQRIHGAEMRSAFLRFRRAAARRRYRTSRP